MMNRAFIALGTNIEPRYDHLKEAIAHLSKNEVIKITKQSSIYQTAPVGYTNQADFLNMVVEVETTLPPYKLLDVCQNIESQLGRKRDIRYGPRTIDLDILVYNEENNRTERLTIPHPRMHERAFVLIPLEEIAPSLILPSMGGAVNDLLNKLPEIDKKDVRLWTQQELVDE
ncbi:2-amino-4-hydroxy-6-hydroxymethyldihydropteridinediphosphokinase [Oceanobacillus limi]|uniref:2-amino-4-hydroxy-6-hydroxymethyldihydropteridine diphosphokinase n=1 Tax=Oceanobacillus limi TaxID=930131 RepID=A0A1I0HLV0_9BACI|nr:2-amino-4-hydroxy-6-hydroxymethyldihydropteridine diphosphokinase [Oceanobacillus limi]SET84095.1 2-amino-4-hydroxy-6-hydroxymethyldihydropteridinediphosphokinase [Oceanobacillus limi]